jgi:hypothetical protein
LYNFHNKKQLVGGDALQRQQQLAHLRSSITGASPERLREIEANLSQLMQEVGTHLTYAANAANRQYLQKREQ